MAKKKQPKPSPTPAELSGYLRCLIYDLNVLATAIEQMTLAQSNAVAEVCKTAALVKLRAVYDFFHRSSCDTIKKKMFRSFNPVLPKHRSTQWDTWLTHQSINTYFVHLDTERIVKTVPQPKFGRGERAVLATAVALLHEGLEFVISVKRHTDFVPLNKQGSEWFTEFSNTLKRLDVLA